MVNTVVQSFRALILDFGDVVVLALNSPERQRWLEQIGRENDEFQAWLWHTPEALAALRGELVLDKFWIRVGAQVGLSVEQSLNMGRDYWAGNRLNEAAVNLARGAREHGLRVGLLSNAYCELGPELAEYGLEGLFDDVVVSAVVGLIKPESAIYTLACSRLGVVPQQALFLDDSRANVEAASGVGLHALQYVDESTIFSAARLLGLPWPVHTGGS